MKGFGILVDVSLNTLFGVRDVDSEFHAGGGEEVGGISRLGRRRHCLRRFGC